MGQRAATAHPERVLMQLLGDPLGLERVLTLPQRFQNFRAGRRKSAIGEDAAEARDPCVRMHGEERVHRVLWLDLGRPAALGAFAEQWCHHDIANADGRQCRSNRS